MANYDKFSIEAIPAIISKLHEEIKGLSDHAEIIESSAFIDFDTLSCSVNSRNNDRVVECLKEASEQNAGNIIRFALAEESNYYSEIARYEIENGHVSFVGLKLNYMVDYDSSKIPSAITEVIEKLKGLDTTQGEKAVYFPDIRVVHEVNGEEFEIVKRDSRIDMTVRDAKTKEEIRKYRCGLFGPNAVDIELRSNNTCSNEECAICGGPAEAQIPLWAFLRGTYETVCDDCIKAHNPDIARILEVFYSNEANIVAYNMQSKESDCDLLF